jgi:pre-mRNA-processing factor 19
VGGSDGTVAIVADEDASTVTLNVGGKAAQACWWGTRAVVGSSTGTITIFERDGTEVGQIKGHSGAVTSLSLHPCGDLLASTGADKSWILYDLTTLSAVTQISTNSGKTNPFQSAKACY